MFFVRFPVVPSCFEFPFPNSDIRLSFFFSSSFFLRLLSCPHTPRLQDVSPYPHFSIQYKSYANSN